MLMGSFCSWPCPDTTPAYTSASRGGPRVPETWSMAWPTTPKWTTAATATQPWCYSREVTLGPCPTSGLPRGAPPHRLPPIGCIREQADPGDGQPLEAGGSSWTKCAGVDNRETRWQRRHQGCQGADHLSFWPCDLGASYLTSLSLFSPSVMWDYISPTKKALERVDPVPSHPLHEGLWL